MSLQPLLQLKGVGIDMELAYDVFAPLAGTFCSFRTFPFQKILYLPGFFDSANGESTLAGLSEIYNGILAVL